MPNTIAEPNPLQLLYEGTGQIEPTLRRKVQKGRRQRPDGARCQELYRALISLRLPALRFALQELSNRYPAQEIEHRIDQLAMCWFELLQAQPTGHNLARGLVALATARDKVHALLLTLSPDGKEKPFPVQVTNSEPIPVAVDESKKDRAQGKGKTRSRGAPPSYDEGADKHLCDDWQAAKREGASRESFARGRGISVDEIIAAQHRVKYRRLRDAE